MFVIGSPSNPGSLQAAVEAVPHTPHARPQSWSAALRAALDVGSGVVKQHLISPGPQPRLSKAARSAALHTLRSFGVALRN